MSLQTINQNATLKTTSTQALSENAHIKTTIIQTISETATIKTTNSSTLQQNAFLNSRQNINQNAHIKTSSIQDLTQDVWVKITGQIQTVSQNAHIKTISEQTLGQNTHLKDTFTKTIGQNASIKSTGTQTLSQNATLKSIEDQDLLQNARLKTTIEQLLSQNATVKETKIQTLDQNVNLIALGVLRLLSQNVGISALGQIQTLMQNTRLKQSVSQPLLQNVHIKANPVAGPVNLSIDIGSVVAPIVDKSEFQVILKVLANNNVPVSGKVVFLQRSVDNAATWKFVRKAVTGSDGVAVIKWIEPLTSSVYQPLVVHYRSFFQTQGSFTENYSIPVKVSVISGNLRNPTPVPFVGPQQAVTMMKGEDFYVLLPDGKWMKLPNIFVESVDRVKVEPNT